LQVYIRSDENKTVNYDDDGETKDTMTTTTALTLFDAHGVLETLFRSSDDVAKCAVCDAKLTTESFYICRYPDAVEGRGRGSSEARSREDAAAAAEVGGQKTSSTCPQSGDVDKSIVRHHHKGHTACKACVDDWKYIGDAGSCIACLRALGNRRSAIKYAGVALRPAIQNDVLNRVLDNIRVAERSVDAAREREEDARIQEGTDRRIAAVEAKRQKRAAMLREAEEEARRIANEITRAAKHEVRAMRKRAEREIRGQQTRAAEIASEIIEEARKEARSVSSGSASGPSEIGAASGTTMASSTPQVRERKRCQIAPEVLEKRRKTMAAKAHKLNTYDSVVCDRERVSRTLNHVLDVSKLWIERLGGDVDLFTRYIEQCIAQVE